MSDNFQRGLQARLAHLIGEASQWSRGSGAHPPGLVKALNEAFEYGCAEIERLQRERDTLAAKVASAKLDEMAMLVRRLVHSLKRIKPDSELPAQAMDYLRRHGLQGSPLRESPTQETPAESSADACMAKARQHFEERQCNSEWDRQREQIAQGLKECPHCHYRHGAHAGTCPTMNRREE